LFGTDAKMGDKALSGISKLSYEECLQRLKYV